MKLRTLGSNCGPVAWIIAGAACVGMIVTARDGYPIAAVWYAFLVLLATAGGLLLDHWRTLDDLERGEALGLEASWERVQGTENVQRWKTQAPGLYVAWDGRSVDEHADQVMAMLATDTPSARTTEHQGRVSWVNPL